MQASLDARLINDCVEGCAASHQELLIAVDALESSSFGGPSRLPGWSRGHVIAHLALNARSHVRLLDFAARGERGEQYPGGADARAAAIEESSLLSPQELVTELRAAIYALEAAWASATARAWQGEGLRTSGSVVHMADLPFLRWREVVVHFTDLDVGVECDSWPPLYLRLELERGKMAWAASKPMGLTLLPARANALPIHERVAWLVGRRDVDGLPGGPGL